jgi:hypothetical protein
MKLFISEQENKDIKLLYEQSIDKVPAAKLDDITISLLPNEVVKTINDEILKNKELVNKINRSFNSEVNNNPLEFLTSNGIHPYLFIIPNVMSPIGEGFPTTGISININNIPFTFNVNLGTNPMNILDNLKFSQIRLNIPFGK